MTTMELFLLDTTSANYGEMMMPVCKFLILVFVVTLIFRLIKNALREAKRNAKRRSSNPQKASHTRNLYPSLQQKLNPKHKAAQEYLLAQEENHMANDGRNAGERNLECLLGYCYSCGYTGFFLHNLYVPTPDGTTTEVDAVYITKKGVFVFESKDYSGWIFGSDTQKQWMQTFKSGKKQPFPNPIWQNDTHIKYLAQFLKWKIPFFSFIVFSNECEIKKMSVIKSQAKVIQQHQIINIIANTFNASPDVFSDEQLQTIWQTLYPLTQKTAAEKDAHIANIQNRHNANENLRAAQPIYIASTPVPEPQPTQTEQKPVCPLCGKEVQERIAQNGDHAGQTYEVCTDYPNCKYAKVKE